MGLSRATARKYDIMLPGVNSVVRSSCSTGQFLVWVRADLDHVGSSPPAAATGESGGEGPLLAGLLDEVAESRLLRGRVFSWR